VNGGAMPIVFINFIHYNLNSFHDMTIFFPEWWGVALPRPPLVTPLLIKPEMALKAIDFVYLLKFRVSISDDVSE
jgi:hypothetical protein